MVQHKGALVILGVIKGTARDRLYQELGLEFLVENYAITIILSTKLYRNFYHLTFKLTIVLLVKKRI